MKEFKENSRSAQLMSKILTPKKWGRGGLKRKVREEKVGLEERRGRDCLYRQEMNLEHEGTGTS